VLVTIRQPHRKLTVALECRDRSRRVTIDQVESFVTKVRHTGVSRGVIVSRLGFGGPALEKARHYGIDCLTLQEAERVDWMALRSMPVISREFLSLKVIPVIAEARPARFTLHLMEGGEELTFDRVAKVVVRALNAADREAEQQTGIPRLPQVGVEHGFIGRQQSPKMFIRTEAGDLPLLSVEVHAKWRWIAKEQPLSFYLYTDQATNMQHSAVRFDIPEHNVEFALVRDASGTLAVSFRKMTVD
jgi:hypothetical protein